VSKAALASIPTALYLTDFDEEYLCSGRVYRKRVRGESVELDKGSDGRVTETAISSFTFEQVLKKFTLSRI
jgi:hypothetical protein